MMMMLLLLYCVETVRFGRLRSIRSSVGRRDNGWTIHCSQLWQRTAYCLHSSRHRVAGCRQVLARWVLHVHMFLVYTQYTVHQLRNYFVCVIFRSTELRSCSIILKFIQLRGSEFGRMLTLRHEEQRNNHLQLVLLSCHPIFLRHYHFLKLVSFLGANRTKSASVCPWLLRGAI